MTAEVTEAPSRVLDTAGLCEQYPQLTEPYAGWECWDDGTASWHATRLPQFPDDWLDEWDGLVAGDALAAERMHWETVNGTLPQARPMLAEPQDELEPLPDMPEHGWLTRMGDELGADDETADAAVTSFMAVHDEQGGKDDDDWAFDEEDQGTDREEDAGEGGDLEQDWIDAHYGDEPEPAEDGAHGGDLPFADAGDGPEAA